MQHRPDHRLGRLTSPASRRPAHRWAAGVHALEGSTGRRHLLVLPSTPPAAGNSVEATAQSVPAERDLPLIVMLHGSGSDPVRTLRIVEDQADEAGAAVLLPKSSGYTWDAVLGGFGPDVAELDRLLRSVFELVPVDRRRMAVGGFSDGASYALSIGRVNGDLFGSVLAFSPGFVVPGPPNGAPRFFVSHGIADPVLPIERCSRLIVPALRQEGHTVDYREFDGGHVVPPELAKAAIGWVARFPGTG
ncbi:alpha/beta hydrolase [Lysobacter korlensis]|uniref:Alpha/beta hydrolase n=1 Tax=Lysobacter korlensis TaxID=553636 RepID=A0ABV6RMG9_9GAMM